MADFSRARRHMVDGQVRTAGVTDLAVIDAMLEVPREQFLPENLRPLAYLDLQPVVSGHGPTARRLLAPMMVGRLLQAAALGAGQSVLIVGCATGYTAALAARVGAIVVATESDSALAAEARANLARLEIGGCTVVEAAATNGCPSRAPFDRIVLDGATEREPVQLYEQMAADGHLVGIFATNQPAKARKVVRSAEEWGYQPLFDASATVLPGLEQTASFRF